MPFNKFTLILLKSLIAQKYNGINSLKLSGY